MTKILTTALNQKILLTKSIISLVVICLIMVGIIDYLNPIRTFLDSASLTFKLGNVTFSTYKILKTLFTLIFLVWITDIILSKGEIYLKKIDKLRVSNKALLIKGFQVLTYLILLLVALNVIGIDLTTLTVVGGAVGIGIGLGLQKITSNFISGLILLFEKSIEEGDLVELIDGTTGFVIRTGARYTLIETFENREIMIPNEDFITNRMTNWTYSNNKGRIDINIGVSYSSDLDTVRRLLIEAAIEHPRCSQQNKAECYLVNFGDNSVNFILYFWVDDIIEGRIQPRSDILFSIWKKFKEHNIKIPCPQRDIHIKNPESIK